MNRRTFLASSAALAAGGLNTAGRAYAFGDVGAFDPRPLLVGDQTSPTRPNALTKWNLELMQRTSAPARTKNAVMRVSDPRIVDTLLLYWSGNREYAPLTHADINNLRRFFALGGTLFVDDAIPTQDAPSPFYAYAKRELGRDLPDLAPAMIRTDYVLFHSFYVLKKPEGRIGTDRPLEGMMQGRALPVLFSSHDVGGAISYSQNGGFELPVEPGGEVQRERAMRLAINLAMYVLCSNYKDDQVHSTFLMRRRGMNTTP